MRVSNTILAIGLAALVGIACSEDKSDTAKSGGPGPSATDDKDKVEAGTKDKPVAPDGVDLGALVKKIGVEPGGWEQGKEDGAEAFVSAREGTVGVRRVGEEAFADVDSDGLQLYAGDQLRTGTEGTATVAMADETVVELAEDSVIAVGDRNAGADPAASVAVLYGVARFSVADRGPGEGPFLVYTSSGIVGTRGTTYAVGVAATGEARIGVEDGEVEIAGSSALDTPVTVAAGKATTVSVEGKVEVPEVFAEDDWGTWRDGAEAGAEPEEIVEVHTGRLEAVEAETEEAYADLEELTQASVQVEATALEQEEAGDAAAYEKGTEAGAVTLEATFLASLRLQQLTYAMLGHAYIANEVYLRHPKKVEAKFKPARTRVYGAILYHKKYHAVVHGHVRPLRPVYYVHHPRGRRHAVMVKHDVPKFYGKVKLKPIPPGLAQKRVRVAVYHPPVIKKFKKGKKVFVVAPTPKWTLKAKVKKPRKYRRGRWYARPKTRRASVFAGVKFTGKRPRFFGVKKPKAKGGVKVRWGLGRKGGKAKMTVGPKGGVRVHAEKGKARKDVIVGPKGGVGVRKVGPKGGVKIKAKGKGGGSIKIRRPPKKKGKRKRR